MIVVFRTLQHLELSLLVPVLGDSGGVVLSGDYDREGCVRFTLWVFFQVKQNVSTEKSYLKKGLVLVHNTFLILSNKKLRYR